MPIYLVLVLGGEAFRGRTQDLLLLLFHVEEVGGDGDGDGVGEVGRVRVAVKNVHKEVRQKQQFSRLRLELSRFFLTSSKLTNKIVSLTRLYACLACFLIY